MRATDAKHNAPMSDAPLFDAAMRER